MKVWLPAIRSGTGTDVFTRRLATALQLRGVDARITWFPHWFELAPELMRLSAVPADADIIHGNGWVASAFAGGKRPLVVTVHHLVHDPRYAPYRSLAQAAYHRLHLRRRELRAIRSAAVVTTVSDYVAATVREFSGREDVATVSNWVDATRFVPVSGKTDNARRPFRLFVAGNHTRRKGADLLSAFVAQLGAGFEIRATGGLRGGSGGAQDSITWLGRLSEDDLIREYQGCDAVFSLSRYEGFGYTALEGMACGKPVLAFATSGLAEVVQSGTTGLLVPTGDVTGLAAACQLLDRDREFSRRLGEAGRQRALSHFSEESALQRYLEIYRSIA